MNIHENWDTLEGESRVLLDCAVRLVVLQGEFACPDLTAGEARQLSQYTNEHRRRSWLRARLALKTLLAEWGLAQDTSQIKFPHRQFSLSHTDDIAVAAGLLGGEGIGVDLEKRRPLKRGAERFFLSDRESSQLDHLSDLERTENLVRLWTAKEAIFKSDCTAQDGVLKHYTITDAFAHNGQATHYRTTMRRFVYASGLKDDCWISIAIPAKP